MFTLTPIGINERAFRLPRNPLHLTFYPRIPDALRKPRRILWGTEAAELLEFGLALPVILVMLLGILDFANAYHMKQKLANAAREGARLGASEPWVDGDTSSPQSVQAIYDDVVTYLQDARVDTSFIGTTMNYDTATCTATYYSSGAYGLKIERNVQLVSGGSPFMATRVTLSYPFHWTYGFDHIIRLMIPLTSVADTIDITTDAMMRNLSL
ncbi:MAG: pilus assembly protein [Acidobacteria bacterium]|nr:pilus assembly protein [Acidobacteriota bacterium]